jgi:hypothetical protein
MLDPMMIYAAYQLPAALRAERNEDARRRRLTREVQEPTPVRRGWRLRRLFAWLGKPPGQLPVLGPGELRVPLIGS